MNRRASAALLVAVALAGCSIGKGPSDPPPVVVDDDGEVVSGTFVTQPPFELGDREPATVLVSDEHVFGRPTPAVAAGVEGYAPDERVAEALGRRAFLSETGEGVADVVVVKLEAGGFSDEDELAAYVAAYAATETRATTTAVLDLVGTRAHVASSGGRTGLSYRVDDLVVVLTGDRRAPVVDLARAMVEALAAGAEGDGELTTPLTSVDPASLFVEFDAGAFQPFPPVDDDPAASRQPSLEAMAGPPPEVAGASRAPEGRMVVVSNEIRAVAWVVPVPVDAYPTAESLDEVLDAVAAARSDGDVTTTVVDGVVVRRADGEIPSRVFHHENVVLVVDAGEALDADATAAAWITALSPS